VAPARRFDSLPDGLTHGSLLGSKVGRVTEHNSRVGSLSGILAACFPAATA